MNDIDIESLWKRQQTPVADLSTIRKKIKCFRLRRIGEAYAVIMLMILVIVFGAVIWICWTPLLTVTKVGITLLSIGFMLPALSYGRLLRLYYGLKIDSTNIDYIDNLLRIKKREYRQQHLILNLYFFFLSIGFALYGYEYTFFPFVLSRDNCLFYSSAVDCSKLVCVPAAYNKKAQSQVL